MSFADHAGSNPKSVFEAAKAHEAEDGQFDEVWLVFDTEGPQNPVRIKDARAVVESARQKERFHTAVSNPCFEYWLILHFERFTRNLADDQAACRQLRRHLSNYDKGCDCYAKIRVHLDMARRNAKELFNERCDQNNGHPCDCHPCTQLFLLMESLLG